MERSSRRDSLNPDDDREPYGAEGEPIDRQPIDLLGYLLGSVEPAEAAAIASRLEADPRLREEADRLYASLPKSDGFWSNELPPAGLADRTLSNLDALLDSGLIPPVPSATSLGSESEPASDSVEELVQTAGTAERHWIYRSVDRWSSENRQWRVTEWVVGLASVTLMAALVLQALVNSRHQARLALCQDNLRTLGRALSDYAMMHRGRLPQGEAGTPLEVAGAYAPLLAQQGLIQDSDVICPSSEFAEKNEPFRIPKLYELNRLSQTALAYAQATMGGDYGFTLGYEVDGVLKELQSEGSPFRVVMADLEGTSGTRHAGRVLNVLFDDGHLASINSSAPHVFDDAFFVNRVGEVAPGLDADDSVIAPSGVRRTHAHIPSVLQ